MKKLHIISALAVAAISLTGCDDFLNDYRYPESTQVVNTEFWSNSSNVQNQVNYFYADYEGYGNRSSTNGTFYYSWLNDDQCGRNTFKDWTFKTVPTTSTSWSAPYVEIRRACLVIEGVESSTLADSEKANYIALARLHRARMYYQLVSRYGDVPLVTTALDPDDEAVLFGPRTDRNEVMDFALEDLNYAVENISTVSSMTEFSQHMAQAMKAEICLYEGTYAKYHQGDTERAKTFLNEAVKAGEAIFDSYTIDTSDLGYLALYQSCRTAVGDYPAMSANKEVIFAKMYEKDVFMHSLVDYSCASDGIAGLTKDAFDSYLFRDGKPSATTTLNNSDVGYYDEEANALCLKDLLEVRDARLGYTTNPYAVITGLTWAAPNTVAQWSQSGYGVAKFNNQAIDIAYVNTANKNYTCAPLFWGAKLACEIVEAKAELSTLSDADVTKYIKPLWERAKIDTSVLNKAYLESINDPANDMNVSSLIWEVRRLRRCELMMDAGLRYWDLVRWKQLEKLDTNKNPDITLGANISTVADKINSPVNGDYLNCTYGMSRTFDSKYYFYPLPSNQLDLNDQLTQNEGWE